MTTVVAGKRGSEFCVKIENHCKNRDICIAVSAIAQTLCQYTDFFRDEHGGIRVDRLHVDYGDVEISLNAAPKAMKKYLEGARAIMLGFELYAENFPDEVRVIFH